ncbi:MAG: hypothetical protein ABI430_01190 [Candidatus Taylorbacteria bacterium]
MEKSEPILPFDYTAPDTNNDDSTIDYRSGNSSVNPEKLTDEQQVLVEKTKNLANKYGPSMRIAIGLLRSANIDALIAMTNPLAIQENGDSVIRKAYQDRYIPFFTDFKSMNEDDGGVSLYFPDKYADEGVFFQETFETQNGNKKTFLMVLTEKDSKIYIMSIAPGKTISEYHK